MQLDLKKTPFGKRLSMHMLYEETDNLNAGWTRGLYLALAAESNSGFIGGPMTGPKGFALITPTSGGKNIEYTCDASPFNVALKTEKGGYDAVIFDLVPDETGVFETAVHDNHAYHSGWGRSVR